MTDVLRGAAAATTTTRPERRNHRFHVPTHIMSGVGVWAPCGGISRRRERLFCTDRRVDPDIDGLGIVVSDAFL